MDDQIRLVAMRIRELREIFDYTIEDVAEKLGISAAQYQAYESSGMDVPISALYRLASLYNVDMTELLSGKTPKLDSISVVKCGEGLNVERYKGYRYENIGYKFLHRRMEPMVVTLQPEDEKPAMVTHSGQEINYCLEGAMTLYYDGGEIILEAGDCAYFDPTRPHGQRAAKGAPAKFLTIINE